TRTVDCSSESIPTGDSSGPVPGWTGVSRYGCASCRYAPTANTSTRRSPRSYATSPPTSPEHVTASVEERHGPRTRSATCGPVRHAVTVATATRDASHTPRGEYCILPPLLHRYVRSRTCTTGEHGCDGCGM